VLASSCADCGRALPMSAQPLNAETMQSSNGNAKGFMTGKFIGKHAIYFTWVYFISKVNRRNAGKRATPGQRQAIKKAPSVKPYGLARSPEGTFFILGRPGDKKKPAHGHPYAGIAISLVTPEACCFCSTT